MVKNEEPVIQKTLEAYLKADPEGHSISYVVFDTGSTDATIEKAHELFKRYNCKEYRIFQEPFIDFSTSRNRALDLTEQCYPQAVFVLMPDAEWYINDVPGLLEYCNKHKYQEQFGPYFVRIIEHTLDFFVPRLIRQKLHSRFKEVVHEALVVYAEQIPYTRLPATIFFEYKPTDVSKENSKRRHLRDLELLLNAYKKDPHNMHTTYYLGQTYESLGDWENAYTFYDIRAQQNGWEEDNFLALYKAAFCAENLAKHDKNVSWDFVHALYLKAYAARPTRIEPLIRIAIHYFEEYNMPLAYLYAKYVLDMPYPEKDTNFVEKEMYHYSRYILVGLTAWDLQQYEIGYRALQKALEARPDNPMIINNLAIYKEKLSTMHT
jgi:glycosyltransferase involved in cell wall biosynthesis